MAHRIEWIVPDHLIVVYMSGLILPQEVGEIARQVYKMLLERKQQSDELVHFIIDSTQSTMAPHVREYMNITFQRSPNLGWTIATGTSALARMAMSIFSTVIPNFQFSSMNTVQDAIEFLSKRDFAIQAYVEHHPAK
jgi:outer membrane phospholipase A